MPRLPAIPNRSQPPALPLYILAGGRSSRFGSDKALATYHGRPLVLHVAGLFATRASRVTVIAETQGKFAHLGLSTLADAWPGEGPLAGLARAAADLGGQGWFWLAPCDLVRFDEAWMASLLACRSPSVGAVAFRHDRWQPLPALYHASVGPLAEAHLRTGRRSLQALLDAAPAASVPLPSDWPPAIQANTPQALAAHQGDAPESTRT